MHQVLTLAKYSYSSGFRMQRSRIRVLQLLLPSRPPSSPPLMGLEHDISNISQSRRTNDRFRFPYLLWQQPVYVSLVFLLLFIRSMFYHRFDRSIMVSTSTKMAQGTTNCPFQVTSSPVFIRRMKMRLRRCLRSQIRPFVASCPRFLTSLRKSFAKHCSSVTETLTA